jgi:uncharacterized protein YjbI with pentapeptide repeats
LWAVGTLFTLVTIALLVTLLVVNLGAVKWKDLSRERIEQVALFIGIAVAVTTLIVVLAIGGASLGWTGFADKTLWEWLQLLGALAIPLVLAIAGFWFTTQQEARQQRFETLRANSEGKIEEQRAQDAALQAYLDQMSTLLLEEKDLRNDRVRTLMRARTLTVLGRLDPKRKTAVMQFLVEAELVQRVEKSTPLIGLSGADLSGANLFEADLSGADLRQAGLPEANLYYADLSYANLTEALLSHADLSYVNLTGADLSYANLTGADLRHADLTKADLSPWVEGLTDEQIAAAQSLYDATMPNGQKYEDWLKKKYGDGLKSTGTADTTGTTTGTTGAPRGTTTSGTTGGANGGTNTTGATNGGTTGTSTTGAATNGGDTTSANDGVMENGKSGGSS